MPFPARNHAATRGALMLLALVCASTLSAQPPAVTLQVRVFDGVEEVTSASTVSVYPADDRTSATTAELTGDSHSLDLEPGLYDLRITLDGGDDTSSVEWYEHLWIQRYPDELSGHLEVLNLQPVFGALLVRPPGGWLEDGRPWHVGAFLADGEGRSGFEPVGPGDQRLFILPAGRYDLRARLGAQESTRDDVEVPAGRTRLTYLSP